MDNHPKRSFKPEVRTPAPHKRADGLRDRMRTATSDAPSQPQTSLPTSDRPIGGDATSLRPTFRSPEQMVEPPLQSPTRLDPPKPVHQTWQSLNPAPAPLSPLEQPQQLAPELPQSNQAVNSAASTTADNSGGSATPTNAKPKVPTDANKWAKSASAKLKTVKLPVIKRQNINNRQFMLLSAISAGVFVVLVGLVGLYSQTLGAKNPSIPESIQLKAKYSLFYAPKNNAFKVDAKTFKYNPEGGLLSYTATAPDDVKLNISQQAAPESMVAGNPAYATLVKSLPGITNFDSSIGKVSVTHPKKSVAKPTGALDSTQFAFVSKEGSILIIRPSKTISDDQWQKIFNSFEPLK